jgi:hypothetical protein
MQNDILIIILIALACHHVGHVFTTQNIFKPLRHAINNAIRNRFGEGKTYETISDLITCPYCFTHYVCLLAVYLFNPIYITLDPVKNFIISWFALVAIANSWTYIIMKIKVPVTK